MSSFQRETPDARKKEELMALMSRHKTQLMRMAYMYLGDLSLAEEAVQDLLPRDGFSASAAHKMKEQDACTMAAETIEAAYRLPKGRERLFLVRASVVNGANNQE